MTMGPGTDTNRNEGLNIPNGNYYTSTYAFPGVVDPLASQRSSLGHAPNENYHNWYRVYGGYDLPNMDSWRMSLLYRDVQRNADDGKPMAFDTSTGPAFAVGDGSKIYIQNHDLRVGMVVYWDGRVLRYPRARLLYETRSYGYGYRGCTSRAAVNVLMRFGNGEGGVY
jgi:hypothetical protein